MSFFLILTFIELISLNDLVKGDKGDSGTLAALNLKVSSSDNILNSLQGKVTSLEKLKGKMASLETLKGDVSSLKGKMASFENKLAEVIDNENKIFKFLNSLTSVLDAKLFPS